MNELCAHAPADVAAPRADACEGCGSRFNLRLCIHCGHHAKPPPWPVGHARAHALGQRT